MSGVGYKQRNKITAALRARADAIKKAISSYNSAASKLNPPRDAIDWAQIVEMVSLADFDLLKDTSIDIRQLTWAKPSHRHVTQLYFDIKRAREEIVRLNVEIKRKITAMLDDSADYYWAEQQAMRAGDSDLAILLARKRFVHSAFCKDITRRLIQTASLHGFSGDLLPGQRLGRHPDITGKAPLPSWAMSVLGLYRGQPDVSDSSTVEHSDGYRTQVKAPARHRSDSSASDGVSECDSEEEDPELGNDADDDKVDRLLEFVESLSV
ncbi:hypothetical protein PQX77_005366 [Marasmius sp. AFHP31]|nr:hypothetical protein PQX77_005366 [Marasmius sp. AFHP31]